MADPTNKSIKGVIDWAKHNPGAGSNSGNSINADLVDGKNYADLKSEWQSYTDNNSASSLEDLTDTDISSPGERHIVMYDGNSKWVNIQNQLNACMDVSIGNINSGDVLTYDDTIHKWTAKAPAASGPTYGYYEKKEAVTNDTVIIPSGVTEVRITGIGGGSGGECPLVQTPSDGAGGGGGQYAYQIIRPVTGAGMLTVTVGKGGNGAWWNQGHSTAEGFGGGDTTVTGLGINLTLAGGKYPISLTEPGGNAGYTSSTEAIYQGTAGGAPGEAGEDSIYATGGIAGTTGGGGAGAFSSSSKGGDGYYMPYNGAGGSGGPGNPYGAGGGGGALSGRSSEIAHGGFGADGYLLIEWGY